MEMQAEVGKYQEKPPNMVPLQTTDWLMFGKLYTYECQNQAFQRTRNSICCDKYIQTDQAKQTIAICNELDMSPASKHTLSPYTVMSSTTVPSKPKYLLIFTNWSTAMLSQQSVLFKMENSFHHKYIS